ncbi:MAG: TonB-dependent receptor [Myxococcota bacterium]
MILSLCAALASPVDLRVMERGSGDPVRATVEVGELTVVTDEEGRVTLDLDGPVQLVVSAEGMRTAEIEVTPPIDKPVRVFLQRGRGPLVVIVEAFRPTPDVSRQVVDAEMAYETPGNLEDAVRLVQSLPGVAVQREYSPSAGTLTIRGSAPHDSRYYLDGIEVPYLYHFNQYASVFPASQLGQLELYSSTFGARYGDSVGAIVEAETARERPEGVHGSAFVNFVIAGGEVRAPVGRKWWVAASGRRSYQDLGGEQSAQYTVWPVFADWALRAEHGDARRGTGFFVWGASDSYNRAAGELDLLDPVEAEQTPQFAYKRSFQVAGVRHHWNAGDDWGRLVVGVVDDRLRGELSSNGAQRQHTLSLRSRLDTSRRFGAFSGWDLGYELETERTDLEVEDPGFGRVLVAEEAPALARGVAVDDRIARTKGGLYGTLHTGFERVRIMPSVRLGFDSTSTSATFEPRLAARWRVGDSTEIRAAGGRYAQRPPTEHLFAGTGDPKFPTTTSWQAAAAIEQTLAGRLTVNVEAYRKWLENVMAFPIDGPAEILERGDAYGVELTWRYRIQEVMFFHGWAAYARSTVGERNSTRDSRRWADGDQPVNLGLVISWDPTPKLNVGARYRLGSGLPYTPLDGSVYDASTDGWIPTPGPDNSARLPLYQKLDLRVALTFPFNRWKLTTSAELWYVPKASAQLYPAWNYDYTEQDWVRGPTLLPLLGARAQF